MENIANFSLDVEHIADFTLASFCLHPEDADNIANLPTCFWPPSACSQKTRGCLQPEDMDMEGMEHMVKFNYRL